MSRLKRFTPILLILCALGCLGASPALAESEALFPWWHVTSVTQPSYVQPGTDKQQVWRLTLSATGGEALLEVGAYGKIEVSAGEPRGELQAAIEGALRGAEYFPSSARLVEVTTEPGPYNTREVYEIKLIGELQYTHYFEFYPPPGEEHLTGGPGMKLEDVAKGRSDGVIVVTATNLGDAPTTTECVKVSDTGKFTNASCTKHTPQGEHYGEFELKEKEPVTITDKLPPGLEAVQIEGAADETNLASGSARSELRCSLKELSCTFAGGEKVAPLEDGPFSTVEPYEQLKVEIAVNVTGAETGAENEASVTGGGAPAASTRRALSISDAPVPFGVDSYEMRPEEAGGGLATQAGRHPFQLTTTYTVNTATPEGAPAGGLTKDLHFELPPGLIGNPTPFARCTLAQFLATGESSVRDGHLCPAQSIVGVTRAVVKLKTGFSAFSQETTFTAPLYNLEPAPGEPARFGFIAEGEPVELDTAVRTGGDYGVTVSTRNITQKIEFLSSEATFWGVPGDERHNASRGAGCLQAAFAFNESGEPGANTCPGFEELNPPPLLSLPTSCPGEPMHTTVEGDSWAAPQNGYPAMASTAPMPTLDGCNRLPFVPEIKVKADGQEASKPSGLTVDVHVPQEGQLNPQGLAQSNVKDITVTLPDGVTLNPSAANGLEACTGDSEDQPQTAGNQIGYEGVRELVLQPGVSTPAFTPYLPGSIDALGNGETAPLQPGVDFCPNASKVAEATIRTPLLPNPVKGFVYLASPQNFGVFPAENPFQTHVAMYIVAEDPVSGSLVKLPGKVELGGAPGVEGLAPGQIRSTFEDNPQLAFEDAELHFFGGERAPLATPEHCGTYTTDATFTPWSGQAPVSSSSHFEITEGPNHTACPGSSLPFTPSLESGTTNNNAGAFSALTTTMSRPSGDQDIQSVTLHYPPGLSGLLSGVELCPEPQADRGTCGPGSQIGETIVSVGVGGEPFTVTGGKAYITGPYAGAPFGLSIVNPAKAGPFDLQEGRPVVVRAKVEVNPTTAALAITTDPSGAYAIPTIVEGFPLQIEHVNVLVNRHGFTFNPTSCGKMEVAGTIYSGEGASSTISDPFQATNCQALKFEPKFTVSTSGKTSKALGASLSTKLEEPAGSLGTQANIAKVKVELPEHLPSRLTTLQKACTAKQFEANPAGCPSESKIGYAVVHTPLVPVPLQGPAIFVSHGDEAFPSLTMVLQGYGVTVDLVGATDIKNGVTSTTFKTVPDQPFNTFELTLPEGKYSALAANGNLCALTKTVTVKKKELKRVHGKLKKVTVTTHKTEAAGLVLPSEFIAQNGAVLKQNTNISVTGCAKAHTTKKAKTKRAKKKKKK